MSFKSKGPKSQPSQSPKANPDPPKTTPEKDSKSSIQKPNQKPNQNSKPQPGKNRPNEETKNIINPPPSDMNNDANNILSNLTSQLNKEPNEPPAKSPLEPNKESKNRIIRHVFKPNIIQNGNNRIRRSSFKPNPQKGSKNIISRLIFDPNKVSNDKNKIVRPKFDPHEVPKNRIRQLKFDPNEKPKNRIRGLKFDPNEVSKNRISQPQFDQNIKPKIYQKLSPKLDNPIHTYENLLDKEIQHTFKEYHYEIGKFANYGRNLKNNFIDWMKKKGIDHDSISKVNEIQNNKEIANFIKDNIKNSDKSQLEISNILKEMGLSVSRRTIGNISLKEVFNDNKNAHHQRFDISLAPEIRENIRKRLREEVEKYNKGSQYDSLYKISKDFPEISEKTVHKIAKNEIHQDLYRNIWPSTSGTVSNETKKEIELRLNNETQKENPNSLRSISNDFPGASHTYVMELARELFPAKYKELWPSIKKIPNKIKNDILKTIKDETLKENPRRLKDIHKEFPDVGADTIKRLAHRAVSKEVHDKFWSNKLSENTKQKIEEIVKKEVKSTNPKSLRNIKNEFGVSMGSVINIAKKVIPKEIYEKIWSAPEEISSETRQKIIKEIKYSKLNLNEIAEKFSVSSRSISNIAQISVFKDDIEKHRERFPYDESFEIGNFTHFNLNSIITNSLNEKYNEKYYSEPRIYSNGRRPDGLILENKEFIQKRLRGTFLREKLGFDLECLREIKATQFDFTNDIGNENLIKKIIKYQSQDTLLIIVGTRWHLYDEIKHLPLDNRIKYPENVRVISHNLGADLIGLEGEDKALYDTIIELNYDHDLSSLKALYANNLCFIESHNTQELKEDLIRNGFIQESFNDYFRFDEFNEIDPKEKQIDLDHFLNL
ncbi:MAG: hypothetical protein ACXAC5_22200 [Promethearchaeota archaeon]|jgi:hypothetical protein